MLAIVVRCSSYLLVSAFPEANFSLSGEAMTYNSGGWKRRLSPLTLVLHSGPSAERLGESQALSKACFLRETGTM